MSRPLTPAAALQNRAFLKALRRTGNVRLAAREVGVAHSTLLTRRRMHRHFAVQWDAALVFAWASFDRLRMSGEGESNRHASGIEPLHRKRSPSPANAGEDNRGSPLRTRGDEPHYVRLKDGRVQVRRAIAGRLTREAEQAFLLALSATCNVTLAAKAVGAAPQAFYRRRQQDPGFAREYRLALERGYERLELALLESSLAGAHEHDEWRRNDPPALPPMSVNQALQQMYLHQKEARLLKEPDYLKWRRGEPAAMRWARLRVMQRIEEERDREEFELAEAERWAAGEEPWGPAGAAVRAELAEAGPGATGTGSLLPDLAQVTGWSRADPGKAAHDPSRALFGGWRIEQMEAKLGEADGEEGEAEAETEE